MATIKSYTDLQQSKKLAEILPLESADMGWYYSRNPNSARNQMWVGTKAENADIPCWSLAALLDVYPMIIGRDMDMYCCWQNSKNLHSRHYNNPIDACYEMINKLHEQKLL